MGRTSPILVLAAVVVTVSCSSDDGPESGGSGAPPASTVTSSTVTATTAPVTAAPATGTPSTEAAPELTLPEWTVRPGQRQLAVLGAEPGETIELASEYGALVAGDVDERGSLLFRDLEPGLYRALGDDVATGTIKVGDFGQHPNPSFYAEQEVGEGFGYIEVGDGTTLSANVVLPGPLADGPYPTVVEYSGYDPSNPDASGLRDLFPALGYAYVGVNIRGSGCSGGAFAFFEPIQHDDGYDVIETIAAQPWVEGHRVGMVGISYSGISQLYVASTRPPSLAAITPLSPVDDSGRYTLYPGGILNDGFALNWARERESSTAAYGQEWTDQRAEDGDTECAANQDLRLQNQPLEELIYANPFLTPEIGDPLSPRLLVGDIDVPVMLAGSWQDEQTGAHFATMLDEFTGTDRFYATLTNGLHTESMTPAVFARYVEFLDLYVGRRVPSLAAARGVVPVLAEGIFGTSDVTLPPDRFEGSTYEDALATFEADAPVRVLFEQGAADGTAARTPLPRFEQEFAGWPVPRAKTTSWYLGTDGALTAEPSAAADGAATSYAADPANVPETYFDPESGSVWSVDVAYDWVAERASTAAVFVSEPFATDTIVMGSGSADLWIEADADDTDVEVTLSEVRPDGDEVLIQSGWLRASRRALDEAASTEVQPVHTHTEDDAEPLPAGEPVPIRVDIFPFAHPVRAGSQLKVTVDAPGGNRQIWTFDTISDGERVTIVHDADHPSRVVLSTLDDVDIPDQLPECGALRGQPCRS